MDSSNWRPAQPEPHREDSAGGGDWRSQLPPDSREQIVGKIVQILKRLLPFSGRDGLLEPETIAMNFEEKIYDASTSQSDYLREASSKMLSLKMLSLKMLAVESKSDQPMPIAFGVSRNSLDLASTSGASDYQEEVYQKINMVNNNANTFSLRLVLEKDKLNGNNFFDCHRNLRIVLTQERKHYVLEQAVPQEPTANAPRAEQVAYRKHKDESLDVACLMLSCMQSDLQKQFERMVDAHALITELKNLFEKQARVERFETTKALFSCKLAEGNPVSPHVLKMIGYVDYLERLDVPINQELAMDLILQSLPESYDQFVMNYIMHDLKKSLTELHAMLKTAEQNIKKPNNVLMVQKGKCFKRVGKGKGKADPKGKGKALVKNWNKLNKANPKLGPATDQQCFYCKKSGHWKRNCKKYLEDKKNSLVEATISGSKGE